MEKIADACQRAGLPGPIILERTGGIAVELVKNNVKTSTKKRDYVSGKRRENVGKTSCMILDACRETPSITIPEMAEKIGITERSIQRNIQNLQAVGLLHRVGGRKEGYWEVVV